jgi:hypothetical protein
MSHTFLIAESHFATLGIYAEVLASILDTSKDSLQE